MNNIFGTDGIRGKVYEGLFKAQELIYIGYALGKWASKKYSCPKILVVNDTRESAEFVKTNLFHGLSQFPLEISDAGILPTPAAYALLANSSDYNCAIVISASHNPHEDNGIKIFDAQSIKLSPRDEEYISTEMANGFNHENRPSMGNVSMLTDAEKTYTCLLKNMFKDQFLRTKKIILDTANGATYRCAQEIFESFGAEVLPIHNKPNGNNINLNCGSTAPDNLQSAVLAHRADLGFAFDGDGDRVIAVNAQGKILDGDDILAFLIKNKTYSMQSGLVGTVMSNHGLELYAQKLNKKFIRTPVGDKNVLQALLQHNLILGGESSGHIICRDYLPTGDGVYTALKIAETAIEHNDFNMKVFEKLPQTLLNVKINAKKDLTTGPLKSYIDQAQKKLTEGRLLVRYSGTENLLRIMVEGKNIHTIEKIAQNLAKKCQGELNS